MLQIVNSLLGDKMGRGLGCESKIEFGGGVQESSDLRGGSWASSGLEYLQQVRTYGHPS